jgi:FRG domain
MARFTRQGARFLDTKDKWERLAFMQHYGVPTKLMDWSTNVTAAIYFALMV